MFFKCKFIIAVEHPNEIVKQAELPLQIIRENKHDFLVKSVSDVENITNSILKGRRNTQKSLSDL
ncbi:MAG: hypothetical protein ACFFDH_09680 [Promethearchaeota archaeon]